MDVPPKHSNSDAAAANPDYQNFIPVIDAIAVRYWDGTHCPVSIPVTAAAGMVVTSSTRIESGSQQLTLSDLSSKTNQSASVHFVPERQDDVAQSIQITG